MGGEVQLHWYTDGQVRRRLAISPAQHQEVKAGVGGDWGDTLEWVGGDGSLGTILLRDNSVSNLVQSRDMGDHRENYSEIIETEEIKWSDKIGKYKDDNVYVLDSMGNNFQEKLFKSVMDKKNDD